MTLSLPTRLVAKVNSLAIATAGDLPSFVKLMNEKAQELGLTNTSFENPIGMDHKNNYLN